MYWPFVVVHILIISIISYDSFPIDLVEIQNDDIYLVDKYRQGRFIKINQTTFLPNSNSIELKREKKSNDFKQKPSEEEVPSNDSLLKNEANNSTAAEQPKINNQKTFNDDVMTKENNYICANSLFEPNTFDYSSLIEDHLMAVHHQPYFSDSMLQMLTDDNCYHFDNFVENFSRDFSCIDDIVDPNESLFC